MDRRSDPAEARRDEAPVAPSPSGAPLAFLRHAWVSLRQRTERARAARYLRRYDRDPEEKWQEALDWFRRRESPVVARVACIVTCHDDWPYVADLLLSLRAQSLPEFEIAIVDGASTDPRSLAMCEAIAPSSAPGREVVRQAQNVGLAAARNRGIERTSAPFVACLDADDVLAPDFLSATVSKLERASDLGFVYFDHFEFGDMSRHVRSRDFDLDELLRQNYVVAAAPFRRAAWQQVGGYREDMVHGYEDWQLWVRLARAGWRGERLRRTLFYYRKRKGSLLGDALSRHEEEARRVRADGPEPQGSGRGPGAPLPRR